LRASFSEFRLVVPIVPGGHPISRLKGISSQQARFLVATPAYVANPVPDLPPKIATVMLS
jgi:hypothetical protein